MNNSAAPVEKRSMERVTPIGSARKVAVVLWCIVTLVILSLGAVIFVVVGALTLFRARRLYNQHMAKWLSRIVLAQWGVRIRVHRPYPWPTGQVVYVSNHDSTLDFFVLTGLGLPNCRFFLSGWLRSVLPVGIIATIMGTFFTVPQKYPEKRTRIFTRATRILAVTGESVYLSPEGTRVTTGEIGHFNKGSFHIATVLRAPIVPLYIKTARSMNPGKSYNIRPGTVHVYFMPQVSTAGWKVEDLLANTDSVRRAFLRFHEEHRDG